MRNWIYEKLSWWLPEKLVYYAVIRAVSRATTGVWCSQEVPSLTVTELLSRWDCRTKVPKDMWAEDATIAIKDSMEPKVACSLFKIAWILESVRGTHSYVAECQEGVHTRYTTSLLSAKHFESKDEAEKYAILRNISEFVATQHPIPRVAYILARRLTEGVYIADNWGGSRTDVWNTSERRKAKQFETLDQAVQFQKDNGLVETTYPIEYQLTEV